MAEVERRIEDVVLRQQTFSRLKHELIRQAMQLSILCDCDVQLFVHSARVGAQGVQGQLSSTQFSSDNAEALMEYVLEHPPAERFGVEDYWHTFKENGAPPHGDGADELQLDRAGEGHTQAGAHDAAPPTCWAPPADAATAAAAAAAVAAGSRGPLVRIVTSGSTRAGSPVPSAGVCQRAAKAPPRGQPNTTHAGLPLRHGNHDAGQNSAQSSVGPGSVRARTGGPVLTMNLSAAHANTLSNRAGDVGLGFQAAAAERAVKRQRGADLPAGVVHIQTEEVDWASSCFAEGDLPSVLDADLTWQ